MSTASIIAVYDGQRLLGHITERGHEQIAGSWPDDVFIRAYRTRKEASDAISRAYTLKHEVTPAPSAIER